MHYAIRHGHYWGWLCTTVCHDKHYLQLPRNPCCNENRKRFTLPNHSGFPMLQFKWPSRDQPTVFIWYLLPACANLILTYFISLKRVWAWQKMKLCLFNLALAYTGLVQTVQLKAVYDDKHYLQLPRNPFCNANRWRFTVPNHSRFQLLQFKWSSNDKPIVFIWFLLAACANLR